MSELYLYFRSKRTHRRLLFRRSEIAGVDRDGWYAEVRVTSGAAFSVLEMEPEYIERERVSPPTIETT